ncbi:MAG: DUF1284 domain-containing protein [Faecousia sp.]
MPMEAPIYGFRPHHGLCLRFFRGKGYSGDFVKNMAEMKAVMETNPVIRLMVGSDEICRSCPNNLAGRCASGEKADRYDREVLRRCGLSEGAVLPYRELDGLVLRDILTVGVREEVCGDCQWSGICHWEGEKP